MLGGVTPTNVYEDLVKLGFFKSRNLRSFIIHAIKCVEHCIKEGTPLIVVAPPGIGKTAIVYSTAIAVLLGYSDVIRVIHVLPLRSIIDDVYKRFAEGLRGLGIDEHLNIVTRQYGMLHGSPYLQATFVCTTIDTYAFSVLKIPVNEYVDLMRHESFHGHYEIPRASIYTAANFLDEAHLLLEDAIDIDRSSRFLRTLMYHFSQACVPLVLLTATLPSRFTSDIVLNVVGKERVKIVDYREFVEKNGLDDFYTSELKKKFKPIGRGLEKLNMDRLTDRIEEIRSLGKLCVFINTVDSSLRLFENFSKDFLLIHSRLTPSDRRKKLEAMKDFNAVISTQVLEAGVDVSFDVMLTELAPISSLVQRLGRLARGENQEGLWLIFYDDETLRGYGVYNPELVRATLSVIDNASHKEIHWHLPQPIGGMNFVGYMQLIDETWKSFPAIPQGLDLDLLNILERLDIDSQRVVKYLQDVEGGSFVRDEISTPLYVGDPPYDYAEFVKSIHDKLVPMSLNHTLHYVKHLISRGYEVSLMRVQQSSEKGDLIIVAEDLRGSNISDVVKKIKHRFIKGQALALAIPKELYEGGVHGRGILWP